MHFDWLDQLKHRDELAFELELVTAVRIGRGKSMEAATDLPILRDARGTPIIPGSSLKGVLRSGAERLLRGLAIGDGVDPEKLRQIACDVLDTRHGCLEGIKDNSDVKVPDRVEKRRKLVETRACLVCATFGGPGLASHVRIQDARVQGALTRFRDGVAIDRDLGRVSGARKYDFEIVEPGTRVAVKIVVDNAREWQLGLLFAALEAMEEGGRIGGFGSRGLGAVRIVGLDQLRPLRRTARALVAREEPTLGPERALCIERLLAQLRERAQQSIPEEVA